MGGRSGGSAEPGQVQQGQPVSALRHRRVFEIRVGGTPQGQDGGGRDPSLRKGAETRPGTNPLKLQTDDGKEFYNKTFRGLMTRRRIRHFSTAGDTKASVVERFNRTLKQRLYRYFTVENTLSFVPVLPEIVLG